MAGCVAVGVTCAFDAANPAANASSADADAATCAAASGSVGERGAETPASGASTGFTEPKASLDRSAGGIAAGAATGAAGAGAASTFVAANGRENNVVRGGRGTFTPDVPPTASARASGAADPVSGIGAAGGGVWACAGTGGIAAITTVAGFAGSSLLSGAIAVRVDSDPRFGSKRGDLAIAGGAAALPASSSRFGTSDPRPLDVSASPPGSVGSNRPALPNDEEVDDGNVAAGE